MRLTGKRYFFVFAFFLAGILTVACQSFAVVQRPIQFDEERQKLSLEYMEKHHGIHRKTPSIIPRIAVIHYTVIPTMEQTFKAFDRTRIPQSRQKISAASELNVSAHYIVDRDGTIYQVLPDTVFARHVIGLNHCAIGIENVGDGDKLPLTKEQLKANVQLVRNLVRKHGIEYLIGHSEYQAFIGHPLWKESDPDYLTVKSDPGDAFMRALRQRLGKLHLKGPPKK